MRGSKVLICFKRKSISEQHVGSKSLGTFHSFWIYFGVPYHHRVEGIVYYCCSKPVGVDEEVIKTVSEHDTARKWTSKSLGWPGTKHKRCWWHGKNLILFLVGEEELKVTVNCLEQLPRWNIFFSFFFPFFYFSKKKLGMCSPLNKGGLPPLYPRRYKALQSLSYPLWRVVGWKETLAKIGKTVKRLGTC